MGALGALGYVIATPRVGKGFTEFYILGLSGRAADYPQDGLSHSSEQAGRN